MLEAWDNIIKKRRQYDCWDLSKELPLETVKEIIQECHTFSAKKQNKPNLDMFIVGWDDMELRESLWHYSTLQEPHQFTINPQTLAHYVICFVHKEEVHKEPIGLIQMGIMADFIVHAAAARGLQTGFCQCTSEERVTEKQANLIREKLGLTKLNQLTLMLGLGHGVAKNEMLNPATGEIVKCWSRIDIGVDPETPPDQYIKFL